MNQLTALVRKGILKELPRVREYCKENGIFKPHVHSALTEVLSAESSWGVEHLEFDALLELDEQFYNEQLKEHASSYNIAARVVDEIKHEWFTRLPNWLNSGLMVSKADEVYRLTVLHSVFNNFFNKETIPSYFDMVAVVKPQTHTKKKIDSHVGSTYVKIALTPMLKPEEVVKVFQMVIDLKDHINRVKLNSFAITLHPDFLNFLTTKKLPEDNVDVMILIASVAASPTPYTTALEIVRRAMVDKSALSKSVHATLKAKAADLDISFGAVLRFDGTPPLSNLKMINLLKKKISAARLSAKLAAKTIYYEDYLMFEPVRYYEDHGKALDNFLEKSDYFAKKLETA